MSVSFQPRGAFQHLALMASCMSLMALSATAGTVRLTIENVGGATPVTPVFAAFHDGTYDIGQVGGVATAGLEALAEVGDNAPIAGEFGTAGGRVSGNVGGAPITPGSSASVDFMVDMTGSSNSYLSLATMVLPSSDYIFGTVSDPSDSVFGVDLTTLANTGTQTFDLLQVYDIGTEVNDFATSAPPIPGAAGLFAGGPFAVLPDSTPPAGIVEGGTIQGVSTPFEGFLNSPFAPGSEPAAGFLRVTLTNVTAVPEPSSGLAFCVMLGAAVLRRRSR